MLDSFVLFFAFYCRITIGLEYATCPSCQKEATYIGIADSGVGSVGKVKSKSTVIHTHKVQYFLQITKYQSPRGLLVLKTWQPCILDQWFSTGGSGPKSRPTILTHIIFIN